MHHQAIHLVKRICRKVIGLDNAKASSILRLPFLLGAQYGIHEIVKEILDSFPDAITFRDEENHTAFHLAVMYRHEKVFKVVEKFVLPQERKSKNCDGKTPLQIFIEEHKELMAYEGQWMMGKATSCTVAASLIAPVVFAVAITVPGGSTVDGFPIFSQKKPYSLCHIRWTCPCFSSLHGVVLCHTLSSVFQGKCLDSNSSCYIGLSTGGLVCNIAITTPSKYDQIYIWPKHYRPVELHKRKVMRPGTEEGSSFSFINAADSDAVSTEWEAECDDESVEESESAAERDISCYLPLHIAILQGNWENASKIFENDPNAITARLTALSETPLLVAVKARQGILFVRKLVELMQPEALALTDYFGNTALHAVAVLGNIIEAKDDEESKPYEGEAGATLMRFAINVGFYDLALDLLGHNPKLAWKDFSPLEVMAQEHSAFPSGTCFNIWKCFIYTC
ncbi:hypothetical protein TEA_016260 [Camellia sinensis var. sinensis]|uniref:PGG domain-containing protein n=1 Tax=Camellia sinensis var. sinensis TaxID=542762 RepID=A0A4S4EV55_CAMSN|nr:hypothetical protein TEA_016260 [Camellia sinensis var. sinensis]